jgi:hypothetical protein
MIRHLFFDSFHPKEEPVEGTLFHWTSSKMSTNQSEKKQYLKVSNAPPVYSNVEELNAYFGEFGGCFVAETLIQAHHNLIEEYVRATQDPKFRVSLLPNTYIHSYIMCLNIQFCIGRTRTTRKRLHWTSYPNVFCSTLDRACKWRSNLVKA